MPQEKMMIKMHSPRNLLGYDGIEHLMLVVVGVGVLCVLGFTAVLLYGLFMSAGAMGFLWIAAVLIALAACWSVGWFFNKWWSFL